MHLPPLLLLPMAPRACAAPGSPVLPPRVPSGCAAVQESHSGRKALGKKLVFFFRRIGIWILPALLCAICGHRQPSWCLLEPADVIATHLPSWWVGFELRQPG